MKIIDTIQLSVHSLWRTKSRSALTILGIVIGIGAVILMLSIGQGAQGFILNQVADLGSDLVFVEPASGDPTSGPPDPFVEQTIDLDDELAMERSGLFFAVSSSLYSTMPVSYGEFTDFFQIVGTDGEQLDIFPATLQSGRFLDREDVEESASVAVIGKDVSESFFGFQDPLGMRIKIKQKSYRVIGVMNEQGSRFFQNLDKQVYVPVTNMQDRLLGVNYVNFLSGRAKGDIDMAKEELRILMRETHDINNPEGDPSKDNFFVSSQTDATEVVGMVGSVLTILLSSIAAISLLVGGIGIMNIMLVSVTERTREIGLRKAVGATDSEVLRQFLVEAVLLTIGGGVIGVLIGMGTSLLIGWLLVSFFLPDWSIVIPPIAVVLAFVVSTIVGLVFGLYPARNASRLNPIDALRYE